MVKQKDFTKSKYVLSIRLLVGEQIDRMKRESVFEHPKDLPTTGHYTGKKRSTMQFLRTRNEKEKENVKKKNRTRGEGKRERSVSFPRGRFLHRNVAYKRSGEKRASAFAWKANENVEESGKRRRVRVDGERRENDDHQVEARRETAQWRV